MVTRCAVNRLRFGKSAQIKTLAVSDIPNLARTIERNYIRKYKAIGQAQFNLNGFKDSEKFRSLKVSESLHERLKFMAALQRGTVQEIVNESLEKTTEPYRHRMELLKRKAKKYLTRKDL